MAAGHILISDIQRATAEHYGIPVQAMRAPRPQGRRCGVNTFDVSHPRQVAMCLATRLTEHSFTRIGHFFNRDRTTVLHAMRKAQHRDKQALRDLTLELLRECGR